MLYLHSRIAQEEKVLGKDKTGWETYDKTFYPYPNEGEEDVFFRKNAPVKDLDSKMNKLIVECGDRKISVFESQIRPIAKYFGEHPDAPTVKVIWVQEGGRVLARIQGKFMIRGSNASNLQAHS